MTALINRPAPGLFERWLSSTVLRVCRAVEAWAERHDRRRIVPDHYNETDDYLVRSYIAFKDRRHWWQLANAVLHHFLISDHDDALHDHPWGYVTVILTGGYWEVTPKGRFWRSPGSILVRSAKSAHRIELDPSAGPVYTLFFMGPRGKQPKWGFCDPEQTWWVEEQHYRSSDIRSLKRAIAHKEAIQASAAAH